MSLIMKITDRKLDMKSTGFGIRNVIFQTYYVALKSTKRNKKPRDRLIVDIQSENSSK